MDRKCDINTILSFHKAYLPDGRLGPGRAKIIENGDASLCEFYNKASEVSHKFIKFILDLFLSSQYDLYLSSYFVSLNISTFQCLNEKKLVRHNFLPELLEIKILFVDSYKSFFRNKFFKIFLTCYRQNTTANAQSELTNT
jgi:hypothetical protein